MSEVSCLPQTMPECTVTYIARHSGMECQSSGGCEAGEPVMGDLVARAHLAGVPTSRTIWTHVSASLDNHHQPPPQEFVTRMFDATVGHPLATWAPHDPAHTQEVLTWLGRQWVERGWPIPNEFSLKKSHITSHESCPTQSNIPSTSPPELYYKTYTGLGGVEGITLLESGGGITHNTTGLTSWCGAAVLAEWATNNSAAVAGRRVLELGAGVGLAGCVLMTQPEPPLAYTATDCHHHVLALLHHNLAINLVRPRPKRAELEEFQRVMSEEVRRCEVEAGEVKKWLHPPLSTPLSAGTIPSTTAEVYPSASTCDLAVVRPGQSGGGGVGVLQVDWRAPPPTIPPVDVVLAADVVYDRPLIPPLITLIRSILNGSAFEQPQHDEKKRRIITAEEIKKKRPHGSKRERGEIKGAQAKEEGKEQDIWQEINYTGEELIREQKALRLKGDDLDTNRETQDEPKREAYLACTRRSQETLSVFLSESARQGLAVDLVYQNCLDSDTALFVYNEAHLPVKVYRLTLAESDM